VSKLLLRQEAATATTPLDQMSCIIFKEGIGGIYFINEAICETAWCGTYIWVGGEGGGKYIRLTKQNGSRDVGEGCTRDCRRKDEEKSGGGLG